MRLIHCACGPTAIHIPGAQRHELPEVPSRKDLRFLDAAARECLPEDPTPSLAEIQANPAAPHLGDPQFAPQQPDEPLRIVVSGTDAALGAILTRMMRADYLWAEVAYLPADPASPAAVNWGVSSDVAFACEAPVRPAACVRTDKGLVVAGSATIFREGHQEFVGEIIVDSETLLLRTGGRNRLHGLYGARLVPTMSAPGIAATTITTPLERRGLSRLLPASQPDTSRVLTGRAVQAGGESIALLIDAHAQPHTTKSTTFYRHLRDIQSVRDDQNTGM